MSSSDPATRQKILTLARAWLGTPYQHQASLKGVGCDCLGLVRGVYAEACGRTIGDPPPYSRDWAEAARRETLIEAAEHYLIRVPIDDARPGDVLIFRFRPGAMAKHCAILSGASGGRGQVDQSPADVRRFPAEAKFIHAVEGAPVCEVPLTPWWRRRIAAVFRFPIEEQ